MIQEKQNATEQIKQNIKKVKFLIGFNKILMGGMITLGVTALIAAPTLGPSIAAMGAWMATRMHGEIKQDTKKLSELQNTLANGGKPIAKDENPKSVSQLKDQLEQTKNKSKDNFSSIWTNSAIMVGGLLVSGVLGVPIAIVGAIRSAQSLSKYEMTKTKEENLMKELKTGEHLSQKEQSHLKSRLHENSAPSNQSKTVQNDKTSHEALPVRTAATNNIEINELGVYTIDLTEPVTAPIIPHKTPNETTRTLALKSITKSSRGS